MQVLGNFCLVFAGLIYLLPLQYLIHERTHKKDEGSGVIAGFFILSPMWLLLLVAMLCVTAQAGFDWLELHRVFLFFFTAAATLSLAIVSFVSFVGLDRPRWKTHLVVGGPIYLLPVLTMLLALLVLNPGLSQNIPPAAYRMPWTILAGISLLGCALYFGYRLVRFARTRVVRCFNLLRRLKFNAIREQLVAVSELDPQRDFADLVSFCTSRIRAVREAALAKLRSNPDLVSSLIAELTRRNPNALFATMSSSVHDALFFLELATFTLEEQKLLALPARSAMINITSSIEGRARFIPQKSRRSLRRQGSRLFRAVAARLVATGVDFQQVIASYEQNLDDPS